MPIFLGKLDIVIGNMLNSLSGLIGSFKGFLKGDETTKRP